MEQSSANTMSVHRVSVFLSSIYIVWLWVNN